MKGEIKQMSQKKYVSLSKLSNFLDHLKNTFASLVHTHTVSDIEDYTVDDALSPTSSNPVSNSVLDAEFEAISQALNIYETELDTHNHDSSYDAKGSADAALQSAQTYTDNAVSQKSQVQLITLEEDD